MLATTDPNGDPIAIPSFCKENCPLKEKCPFFVQSNTSSFISFSLIFVTMAFSLKIRRNITSMVKSNGMLGNKEDTLKETNFQVLSNGTTFFNF